MRSDMVPFVSLYRLLMYLATTVLRFDPVRMSSTPPSDGKRAVSNMLRCNIQQDLMSANFLLTIVSLVRKVWLRKALDAFTLSLSPSYISNVRTMLDYSNNREKLMKVLLQSISKLKWILIVADTFTANCICAMLLQIRAVVVVATAVRINLNLSRFL